MSCLIVDEAIQIVNGAYPHLIPPHAATIGRIGFFGDDHQLAPFGSDTIVGVDSAFALRHLRDRANILNRCYRLPSDLAQFISKEVYEEKLMPAGPDVRLGESIRFFDLESGCEERAEVSFTNPSEAKAICDFVRAHMTDASLESRILAPYIGQRDLLESMLKGRRLPRQDRVFRIDSFQGHEAEVIVISLLRDGFLMDGNIAGFLVNRQRTKVLLSRSKRHVYVSPASGFSTERARKAQTPWPVAIPVKLALTPSVQGNKSPSRRVCSRKACASSPLSDVSVLSHCLMSQCRRFLPR